jgi:flagellar basal body P-ring formation protein FlgA
MNSRLLQRFAFAALALLLLKPVQGRADEVTDPQLIRAAAEQAVMSAAGPGATTLRLSADALDNRLRLAACPVPLVAVLAGDGQLRERATVQVRCEAGVRWSIYVPVNVASELPVLVAQRALSMGASPAPADFSLVSRRLPGLSSRYVSDPAQLAGQRLRRPVALGEALPAEALAVAPVVRRGQQLTLLAHVGAMDVRATVIAMSDGRPDERIRVQNQGSQKVVEAVVRSSTLAEAPL